jgi:hypothetical protein
MSLAVMDVQTDVKWKTICQILKEDVGKKKIMHEDFFFPHNLMDEFIL